MRGRGRAAFCILGSAAAHAALIAGLAQPHAGQGSLPPHPGLRVRLVLPQVAAAPDAGALSAVSPSVPVAPPPEAAVAPQAADTPPSLVPQELPAAAPPAPVPAPDRPRYYLPSELSERTRLADDANPDLVLSLPGVQAQDLDLRLLINRDGGVDQVVIEGSQQGAQLDGPAKEAVLQAFAHLQFVPGKLDGHMVNSQLRIQVHLDTALQVLSSVTVH